MKHKKINVIGLNDYEITEDGVIYLNGKPIPQRIDHKGYYRVSIKHKNYMVHRLVALTFLEKVENKDIIDHIDGNKLNNNVSNLRWCTRAENNLYKFEQGLETCSEPVITINVKTGERKNHYSITQACKYIGHSRINTSHTPLYKNRIYKGTNGEFNIIYKNKETPEYINKKMVSYVFTNNNKTEVFYTLKDLSIRLFGKVLCRNLEEYKQIVKALYPNSTLVINRPNKYFEVYEVKTKKISRYKNLAEVSKLINIPKSTIAKFAGIKKEYNGYLFRHYYDNYYDWNKYEKHEPKNKPVKILILDLDKNWFIIKDSVRSAASYFGVDKNIIRNALSRNGDYKNRYKILELK